MLVLVMRDRSSLRRGDDMASDSRRAPRFTRGSFVCMVCLTLLAVTPPLVLISAADAPTQPQSDPACAAVVGAVNGGGLPAITVPSRTLSKEEARRIIPDVTEALAAYYEADLDGDGELESVGVLGSKGADRVSIISARSRVHADVTVLNEAEPGSPVAMIRLAGRAFLLSGEPPTGLYELGPNSRLKQRCTFGRAVQPVHLMTVVEEPAVCAAYERDALPRVAFDRMHLLGLLDRTQYPETRPVDGLARVDIDNDGAQENIVRLRYSGPAGPLCGTFFAVAEATRMRLANSPLNAILRQMPCAAEPRLLTSAGRTYVALQETDSKWSLLTIRENGWRRVCVREARAGIRALSPREAVEARAGHTNPWLFALTDSPDAAADVQALIQGGRDVNETIAGGSPLQHAVWAGRSDVAALLLAQGVRSDLMQEALDRAVWRKDPDMVLLLIQHGATPSTATLASLACEKEVLGVLELFGQAGLLPPDTVTMPTPQRVPRHEPPSGAGEDPATHAPGAISVPAEEEMPLIEHARRCGNLDAIRVIERYRGHP